MDAVNSLMFALVFGLTLLPLAVILPSAPPMTDDASPTAAPMPLERAEKPNRRLCLAKWRISITIGRVDDGLKASNLP